MSRSIQQQLLKAGLIKKSKLGKQKRVNYKNAKNKGKQQSHDSNLKSETDQALLEKQQRDRELNRLKNEEASHKALIAQIRQLIRLNCLPKDEGDISYHFSHNNIVKNITVTEVVRQGIIQGRLSIVFLEGNYEVVPSPVAEKIKQRSVDIVILSNNSLEDNQHNEYSDYKIPDDLMW